MQVDYKGYGHPDLRHHTDPYRGSRDQPGPVTMYTEIRPTGDALAPATVTDHTRRLHGLDGQPHSWFRRLFADIPEPFEFLLVADGDDERAIDYYAGVPDEGRGDQFEHLESELAIVKADLERLRDTLAEERDARAENGTDEPVRSGLQAVLPLF